MDAPLSGGKIGAATKNLTIMVDGDVEIYQHITSILSAFGDKILMRDPSALGVSPNW